MNDNGAAAAAAPKYDDVFILSPLDDVNERFINWIVDKVNTG